MVQVWKLKSTVKLPFAILSLPSGTREILSIQKEFFFRETHNQKMTDIGRDPWRQPDSPKKPRFSNIRLHRTMSGWVLNTSRGDIQTSVTTSLDSLFQCSVSCKIKIFFLIFRFLFQFVLFAFWSPLTWLWSGLLDQKLHNLKLFVCVDKLLFSFSHFKCF